MCLIKGRNKDVLLEGLPKVERRDFDLVGWILVKSLGSAVVLIVDQFDFEFFAGDAATYRVGAPEAIEKVFVRSVWV